MRKTLREARKTLGLTQEQVAHAVGIDRTAYCRIELGVRNPTIDVAIKIANILGKSVEELFMPFDVHLIHKNSVLPTGTEGGEHF